ncbi:MAG: hypothetical protein J6R42_03875, partial [Clostridia bacterium]|nr:hypothetical protein [Clostridia bacterium]
MKYASLALLCFALIFAFGNTVNVPTADEANFMPCVVHQPIQSLSTPPCTNGHQYGEGEFHSICGAYDYTVYICTACEHLKVDVALEPTYHDYEVTTSNTDCGEYLVTTETC